MKLKDSVFWGFTKEELEEVRKVKGAGDRQVSLADSQDTAGIIGSDVVTVIAPGGIIAFIKAGE